MKEQGKGPVADIGSGPGHVTAALHKLGVPVFGVDVGAPPRRAGPVERAGAFNPASTMQCTG
ncbi:class I SAM-dependent methyltransferase [Streptomyces canus]|uniref:class I SAM-dependent methyltransferase n=1 Tax=Streptomyces canus TaxID=58343 RepID=UPI0033C86D4B